MISTKHICVSLLSPFLLAPTADAISIMLEDFEDLAVNYVVSGGEFHDGPNDLFTIVPLNGATSPDDGPYTSFGGSSYFAAEDINDADGPGFDTQILTFNINITGALGLTFDGLFAAGGNSIGGTDAAIRYDDEDGIRVRAQIDGGLVQNLLAFEALEPGGDLTNNELRLDADFDGIGDVTGFLPTSTMTAFNGLDITGTGANLVLTIEVTSTAGGEAVAFDNIEVSAVTVPEPSSALLLGVSGIFLLRRRSRS